MHVWKGCGGGTIRFTLLRGLFDAFFLEARFVVAIFYSFGIAVITKLYQTFSSVEVQGSSRFDQPVANAD